MQNDLFRLGGVPDGMCAVLAEMHGKDSDVWRPRRAMLQNWWLFGQMEELHFGAGNLMLTGTNQSGKTTVLVSLITLVMDRLFAPHRIDASGSGAKTVRYYLVGDEDVADAGRSSHEERTGYVALEFQRGSSNRWVTIGIALRARWRDNKTPSSWSFVINGGRRVGHDLSLADESGKPLSLSALEKTLGGGGLVFNHKQVEAYQKAVNDALFGFPDVEDYRRYLDMLHTVRRPKLGDGLTPESVTKMLVAALPRISAAPIEAAGDSFAKLDAIAAEVQRLEQQRAEADALDTVQIAFLEAQACAESFDLLKATNEEVSARKTLDSKANDLAAAEAEDARAAEQIALIHTEQARLEGELEPLVDQERDHKAYDARKLLDKAQESREQATRELKALERDLDQARDRRRHADEARRQMQTVWDEKLGDLSRQVGEYASRAREAYWNELAIRAAAAEKSLTGASVEGSEALAMDLMLGIVDSEAQTRRSALSRVVEAKEALEDQQRKHLRAQDSTRRAQYEFNDAEKSFAAAEDVAETAKNSLVEAVGTWRDGLTVLTVSELQRVDLVTTIDAWNDPKISTSTLVAPLQPTYQRLRTELRVEREETTERIATTRAETDRTRSEVRDLENSAAAEPLRRDSALRARRVLQEEGVPAVPLYAAVDFQDVLESEIRIRIEAALEDAGLLDALVVPRGRSTDVRRIMDEHGLADRWIEPSAGEANAWLRAERLDWLTEEDVGAALRSIGCGLDAPCGAAVASDGAWRVGPVFGRASSAAEHVRYIGETNRAQERARRLTEALQRLQEAEERLEALELTRAGLARREERLEREWMALRELEQVRTCVSALDRVHFTQGERDRKRENLRVVREAESTEETKVEQERQKVFAVLIDAPYAERLTSHEIREVRSSLAGIARDAASLRRQIATLGELRAGFAEQWQRARDAEASIQDLAPRVSEKENQLQAIVAKIDTLQAQLAETSVDLEELRAVIQRIRNRQKELADSLKKEENRQLEARVKAGMIAPEMDGLRDTLREKVILRAAVEQALKARLSSYQSLDGYLAIGKQRGWVPVARELTQGMEAQRAKRSADEAKSRLVSVYHEKHQAFGGLAPRFDDERGLVLFYHPEGEMRAEELSRHLEEELARKSAAHSEEYQKIIEAVLLREISSAIRRAIHEAQTFIDKMSQELRAMDLFKDGVMQLSWSVRKPSEKDAADPQRLADLFSRTGIALTSDDQQELISIFTEMVDDVRRKNQAQGGSVDYRTALTEVLDYTQWFTLTIERKEAGRFVPLTRRVYGKGSEGRKALDLILPLMAAVRARLESAAPGAPRMIGFDEAFAGLDTPNSVAILRLLSNWHFCWVMATEKPLIYGNHLKGVVTYEFVNDGYAVATIPSIWDGKSSHTFDQSLFDLEGQMLAIEGLNLGTDAPAVAENADG